MFQYRDQTLDIDGNPEQIAGMLVTSSFFDVARVRPSIGRGFETAEEEPGKDDKVILSSGLAKQLFGAESAASRTDTSHIRSHALSRRCHACRLFVPREGGSSLDSAGSIFRSEAAVSQQQLVPDRPASARCHYRPGAGAGDAIKPETWTASRNSVSC